MSAIENVSRREFFGAVFSAGAFVLVARVMSESASAQNAASGTRAGAATLHPSVYLGVEPDGTVFIVTHRSEMGTGIRTSLPMVAAEELDADWSRVRIEQGLGDAKYGDQNTDGSRSIRDYYAAFRQAGASARRMLVGAAAAQWSVPVAECVAQNHEVLHQASGRRLAYGALVPAAARLPVPKAEELTFKPKTAWRLVGKEHPIYDLSDIITGKAQFGNDVVRDGMVYASVEHPPVFGGRARGFDDKEALKVRGVRQTATIEPLKLPYMFKPLGGVAVIGDNTWSVLQGRKRLTIDWEDGAHASFDSDRFKQQLLETVGGRANWRAISGTSTRSSRRAARSSRRPTTRRCWRTRRWNRPQPSPSTATGKSRCGRRRRIRRRCRTRSPKRSASTRKTSLAT
jgi:isoquinoline 1-oxidoreductase beta subunit